MLWRVTLALAVVCVGSVCNCIQADLMSRLVMPRDYGVKLCGREFIRAVIFTCGGSRWRRATHSGESKNQKTAVHKCRQPFWTCWREKFCLKYILTVLRCSLDLTEGRRGRTDCFLH